MCFWMMTIIALVLLVIDCFLLWQLAVAISALKETRSALVKALGELVAVTESNGNMRKQLAAYTSAEAEQRTLAAWRENLQVASVVRYGDYVVRIRRISEGKSGKIAVIMYPNCKENGISPRTVKIERLMPVE